MAAKLDRVIETCLYVDDLSRAAQFYEEVLGLEVLTADSRFRAYDVGGASVLLMFRRGATLETVRMPGGTIPPMMVMARCTWRLRSARTTCAIGCSVWPSMGLPSKAKRSGPAAAAASISAILMATCSNSRHRGCGRSTEINLHNRGFVVILGSR